MRWVAWMVTGVVLSVAVWGTAVAQEAAPAQDAPVQEVPAQGRPTGLEVMRKGRLSYIPKDQRSVVTLRLIDKTGGERRIVTTRFFKNEEGRGGLDSKIVFFTESPKDVRGMGFLIQDYVEADTPDDLWLYLPATRQTRRLSTRDQHDAFMGSDLTFGDMGQRALDEDEHLLLGEGDCLGKRCWVVESIPKEREPFYQKRVFWISKDDWLTLRIDYYDMKGEPLKLQTIAWQKVGELFAWKSSEVRNFQTEHRTVLEISDLALNVGLPDSLFTRRQLALGPPPGQ